MCNTITLILRDKQHLPKVFVSVKGFAYSAGTTIGFPALDVTRPS